MRQNSITTTRVSLNNANEKFAFSYDMAGTCCQAHECQVSMKLKFDYLWE